MADPEIVKFIRTNLEQYGEDGIRRQLNQDGISSDAIEDAFLEAGGGGQAPPIPAAGKNTAVIAVMVGGLFIAIAMILSSGSGSGPADTGGRPSGVTDLSGDPAGSSGASVFRGYFGFILRLPPGYTARGSFANSEKTVERVYIYKKDLDPTLLSDPGMFAHLGILRLEVWPRRRPQGVIGLEALRAEMIRRQEIQKASYTTRDMVVQGMPAFILTVTKPFQMVQSFVVGEKVYYTMTGGEENDFFNEVLSTLAEVSPHDRPGP